MKKLKRHWQNEKFLIEKNKTIVSKLRFEIALMCGVGRTKTHSI